MLESEDYTGKKVIIYDVKNKKTIAESLIIDFNKGTKTIMLDRRTIEADLGIHVSLLILGNSGIYEYQGTVRQTDRRDRIGIALFSGKEKEDRKYTRYTVHAPAVIEGVMIGNKLVPMKEKCEVDVVNISADGILIEGSVSLLNIGTVFQIRILVNEGGLLLTAEVVRSNHVALDIYDFGCRLTAKSEG